MIAQLRPNAWRGVLFHGFVLLFGFAMLYPLLWMFASSLKPNSDIFRSAAANVSSYLSFASLSLSAATCEARR